MIWVAPTEHEIQKVLRDEDSEVWKHQYAWKISSIPERHGCDLMVPTRLGIVGFQRKTLPDLVSSLQDGRLYYELNQINASATVKHAFLCLESAFVTTVGTENYVEVNISVSTVRSIIAKFAFFGVGFIPTRNPEDTLACALSVSRYLASGKAGSIQRTKNVSNEWGRSDAKGYGLFLLQSFPGIGPKVAEAIYDHFNGVPITWAVNAGELAQVPGIGRKKAEALVAALRPGGAVRPA